jgi:hypothetical protein
LLLPRPALSPQGAEVITAYTWVGALSRMGGAALQIGRQRCLSIGRQRRNIERWAAGAGTRHAVKLLHLVGAALVSAALFVAPAAAQVGTGWTAYTPSARVQTRGCGAHSASAGVDTFRLTCDATSGDNRAEARVENDYSSGTNQFEGEVRVVSLDGSNVSLKQTFMPNNGAFLMLGVSTGGRLYSVGDNFELATGIIGRWVRINTVHDVAAGTHQIYVDGVLKATKTGGRQVAWHDKYGTYRLGSGHGPIVAEWRNIRYFRGGRATGGTTPPPPPPADGGTPEVGGTGGTGGSGGTSGSGGTGGSAGTGGSGGGAGSGSVGTGGSGGGAAGGSGGTGGSGGGAGSGSGGTSGNAGTSGGGSGGAAGAAGMATGGTGAGGSAGRGGRGGAAGASASGGGGAPAPAPASAGGCAVGGRPRSGAAPLLLALGLLAARLRRAGRRPRP